MAEEKSKNTSNKSVSIGIIPTAIIATTFFGLGYLTRWSVNENNQEVIGNSIQNNKEEKNKDKQDNSFKRITEEIKFPRRFIDEEMALADENGDIQTNAHKDFISRCRMVCLKDLPKDKRDDYIPTVLAKDLGYLDGFISDNKLYLLEENDKVIHVFEVKLYKKTINMFEELYEVINKVLDGNEEAEKEATELYEKLYKGFEKAQTCTTKNTENYVMPSEMQYAHTTSLENYSYTYSNSPSEPDVKEDTQKDMMWIPDTKQTKYVKVKTLPKDTHNL